MNLKNPLPLVCKMFTLNNSSPPLTAGVFYGQPLIRNLYVLNVKSYNATKYKIIASILYKV